MHLVENGSDDASKADQIIKPVDAFQLESALYRVARAAGKIASGS